MRIPSKIKKELVEQLQREYEASFFYQGAASFYYGRDLDGFANFMQKQYEEERSHAEKIYNFLIDVDAQPRINTIDINNPDFETIIDPIQAAYDHERAMSDNIRSISRMVNDENAYNAFSLLNWLEDEQVEEENVFERLLKQTKMAEGDSSAILLLDDKLSKRNSHEDLDV